MKLTKTETAIGLIAAAMIVFGAIAGKAENMLPFYQSGRGMLFRYQGGSTPPAAATYTNSLHEIDSGLWASSVGEYLFEDGGLSWTNNTQTNDTSYAGVYPLTNIVGAISIAYTNAGWTNGVYSFDGSDDYMTIPCPLYTSTNTVEGWFYLNSSGQAATLWGIRQVSPENQVVLRVTNPSGSLHSFMSHGYYGSGYQWQFNCATNIAPSNWVHVAVTWEKNNARMYTNGILAASDASVTSAESTSITQKKIGQNEYATTGSCKMLADGVRFYNKLALSSNEIYQIFNATKYRYGL